MRIGALALQGDFREHLAVVAHLGHTGIEVRTPDELESVEALIIPGGRVDDDRPSRDDLRAHGSTP